MSHIFLSYSRKDEKFVSEVNSRLKQRGVDIWQDISGKDSGIPFSTKWWNIIEDALYKSVGAICFSTESWDRSVPCNNEYLLIKDCGIPHFMVSGDHFDDIDGLILQIFEWLQSEVDTEANSSRSDLLYRSWDYRFKKKGHLPFVKGKTLASYKKNQSNSKQCLQDRIYELQKGYLTAASRSSFMKKFIAVFGVVVIILGIGIIIIMQLIDRELQQQVERQIALTVSSEAFVEDYHVYPFSIMNNSIVDTAFDTANTKTVINSPVLMELNNLVFPSDIIRNNQDLTYDYTSTAELQNSQIDDRVLISITPGTGLATITYQDTGRVVSTRINGTISEYSWNSESMVLAMSSDNKVYLWIPAVNSKPYILDGNLEEIVNLGWEDDQIFAITTSGNIVFWKNPLMLPSQERKLSNGRIIAGEIPRAVYLADNCLITNNDGTELVLPLSVNGTLNDIYLAVSKDGKFAAVRYASRADGFSHILVIDLDSQSVVADCSLGCSATGFDFSDDNRYLYFVSWQEGANAIGKLDLTSETLLYSDPLPTWYQYIEVEGNVIIASGKSKITVFNESLEDVSGIIPIQSSGAIPKRMALSTKHGYLAFSCSGRSFSTTYFVGLTDEAKAEANSAIMWHGLRNNDYESVPSVAISPNESHIAYGFSNGQIWIYSIDGVAMFGTDKIQEVPIDLYFSADSKTLFALGESGTIYTLEIGDVATINSNEVDYEKYWNALKESIRAKHEKAWSLGLTNISPEDFGKKIVLY